MVKSDSPISREAMVLQILRKRFPTVKSEIPHSIADIRHEYGSVSGALLYASLFVPNFSVIDGSVILDDDRFELPEEFRKAKENSTMDLKELEASFNWRELPYLFINRECTDTECGVLAELIVDAWKARLSVLFPERQFVVRVLHPEETGGVIGIGFEEQKRRA